MAIELNIDQYGSKARHSAIADYLEALALSGHKVSVSDLADYIENNGWQGKLREHYIGPGMDDDSVALGSSPSEDHARKAFDILDERRSLLGSEYPFSVQDSGVAFTETDGGSRYLVLLGITLAHSYNLQTASKLDPKATLEDVTVEVMNQRSMRSVKTAFAGQKGTFDECLLATAETIGLRAMPGSVVKSRHAKDEGVDVLGVFDWINDIRPGRWTFIGQVTCAESDEWKKKLGEPSPPKWGPLLGVKVPPVAFLAVPYHVQNGHLLSLMTDRAAAVLDRLRMTPFVPTGVPAFNEFAALARSVQVTSFS
jgi:hypothetical protein